nr:reverse transcriptase domain-containing protein [Tanacetum cinerariifolium]
MSTRSSSNLPCKSPHNPSNFNPKRRNRKSSKQPFILEESLVDTMADQRTMAELLRAPTEGYAEAIVVPPILAETTNLRNEISNFHQRFDELFHEAWDRYKYILRACPHHGFTELHQLDTFNNALNLADQDSLNSVAGDNLLERRTQDVLTIIENKSKQTSAVTTAMTAILKQFQATSPPASVKAVEEICVTYGGAHLDYQCLTTGGNTFPELRDNIQGYVAAAAVNYNQGNFGSRPLGVANQIRPPGFAQPNVQINQNQFSKPQGYNRGSGHLPSNTLANPKGKLKAITTRSGIVLDEPFVPIPLPFINPKEDERVEETLTDQDLTEYTIKVLPPLVQKSKPHYQRNFAVHQRDPLHPNIPYPSRMHKQKQQEKDEVQIHKFWQMFKQLHINITLADAPQTQGVLKEDFSAYVKANDAVMRNMQTQGTLSSNTIANPRSDLKAITTRSGVSYDGPQILPPPSSLPPMVENEPEAIKDTVDPTNNGNTEDLSEMARTPLNEHCSAVLRKKLPEKLGNPCKFLIPCDFPGMVECLALADLGASIDLMPYSIWTRLTLSDLTPTCMTLELADHSIISPIGIAEDVYVKEILGFSDTISSGNTTPFYDLIVSATSSTLTPFENSDFLLEEVNAFLAVEDEPTSFEFYQPYLDPEGDILLLEAFLNNDPSLPLSNQRNYLPEVSKELKICEAHSEKSLVDEPLVAELKELPPHLEYAFLEGDDKLPVIIAKDLSVEEKTALITILKSHNPTSEKGASDRD